ncbi:MAG: M56 family metallopeptidase [Acidobacteria bacterium]|nr:M56 family metallopeptidase [Acidobacteriota bacterium]
MHVLAQLLNILLPSAALVAGVWGSLRLLRPNAATRCAAWGGVLVLLGILPFVHFETDSRKTAVEPIVYLPSQPAEASLAVSETIDDAAAAAAPAPVNSRSIDLMETVPFFYAVGVLFLLVRLAADYLRIRSIVRTSQPAPLTYQRDPYFRRIPRVLVNSRVETPFAAGFMKPAIVLPASLPDQLSDDELQHVLLHEMAHIARRDDWTNLLAHVVQAFCWPNPFVAFVMRRIDSEREQACDDWVVSTTGNAPVSYAKSLARLMEIGVARREPLLASTMVGRGGIRVSQRVEKLLDRTRTFAPRVSLAKFGMSLVCLAVFGLICMQAPAVAAFEFAEPQASPAQKAVPKPVAVPVPVVAPAPPQLPPPSRPGFLAALADAGYKDLSVEQVIDLKNHGVSPDFLREMNGAGWGKLSVGQLIELRNRGMSGAYLQELRGAGIRDISLERAVSLRDNGVKPRAVAEIHSLGFGPYGSDEVVDMARHGVGPEFFRSLKEYGIAKMSAREAIEGAQQGLNGRSIQEARKYGPNLTFEQILKLKRAGVI